MVMSLIKAGLESEMMGMIAALQFYWKSRHSSIVMEMSLLKVVKPEINITKIEGSQL